MGDSVAGAIPCEGGVCPPARITCAGDEAGRCCARERARVGWGGVLGSDRRGHFEHFHVRTTKNQHTALVLKPVDVARP